MTVAFLVIVGALGLLGLIALLHLAWALILLVFWLIDGDQKLLWGALEMFGLACVYNAPAAIAGYFWAGTLDRRRAQHSDAPFKD
ncbi:hypothetical protein [Falsiroseomonas sp.]|uniref:hypothetical protein n=1 Tax=Falsiroseomonas sp. TaxID=2870721 RepID=UPI003F72DE39